MATMPTRSPTTRSTSCCWGVSKGPAREGTGGRSAATPPPGQPAAARAPRPGRAAASVAAWWPGIARQHANGERSAGGRPHKITDIIGYVCRDSHDHVDESCQLGPQPIERDAARVVLEARDRRLRRPARAGHRVAPQQQLVDRVVGEPVRIVAIGMPAGDAKTRWPTRSSNVWRIFSGARPSTRHRANVLTKPYTRSAALSRMAPPSELACSRSNVATTGLPNRSANRTLCAIVGSVTQEPPSCHKRLSPTVF